MIWILRNEEGRGFIQINGWVCEMNRIQHKKWIDTLGIGLFILTLLYMCGLTSNKDEIEIEQNVVTEDKIQQEADNELPADFPKDLFFNSGAGGWRTYLRLNSIEKDIYLFYNQSHFRAGRRRVADLPQP